MLTQQEKDFIDYWERNRDRQKKLIRQFLVGIPVGLLFAVPIIICFASGWFHRAMMVITAEGGAILLALVVIVVFIAIFSQQSKWDQLNQRYLELIARRSEGGSEALRSEESPGS
jgi:membrane protein YdbS with pleckstrin-like domain